MRRMNAYSEDLRKKIVEALERDATKSEAARAFGESGSWVKRYAELAWEGLPPAPKKAPGWSRKKVGGCDRTRRVLKGSLADFGRRRDLYAERPVFVDEMDANISLAPLSLAPL